MKLLSTKLSRKRRRGVHSKKRTSWQRWSEYLWPSMGITAFLRWLEIRIKRTPGESDRVGMGAAIGMFVTFLPFVGLQILLMLGLCKMMRGHFWVAIAVSFVGNPWTFPFIWLVSHQLGMMLLWRDRTALPDDISLTHFMNNMGYYWDAFLWPTFIGGLPLGLLGGILTFYFVRFNVQSYRKARAGYLRRRRSEERTKLTTIAKETAQKMTTKAKETAAAVLKKDPKDDTNEKSNS